MHDTPSDILRQMLQCCRCHIRDIRHHICHAWNILELMAQDLLSHIFGKGRNKPGRSGTLPHLEPVRIYENLSESVKDEWQMVNIRMFGIGLARVCFDTSMWKSGRVGKKTNKFWLNSTMPKFFFWGITFPLYVSQARHLLRVFLNGRFGRCFQAQDQRCRASHLGPGILERTRVGPLGHCMTSESECSHCARHQDRSRQLLRVGLRPNSLVEGRCEALALISMNVTSVQ